MAAISRRLDLLHISETTGTINLMQINTTEILNYLATAYSPTFKFAHDRCANPQFDKNMALFRNCRQCPHCLELKRREWTARSVHEQAKWPKAWFLTLTYGDINEYTYQNVKLFFANLRKRYGKRISYICTDESDSSGQRDYNPHHHMVIYSAKDLTYRHFDKLWKFGHRKLNLLEAGNAGYVTKYLTKTGTRVRASQDFGKHTTKYFNPIKMGIANR